ncbi:hypothetical protein EYR38_008599 [Pleurotus pulmonarius]|nr:hypothetical protein EYR38_008599 [Pleurotus pulmonarius]
MNSPKPTHIFALLRIGAALYFAFISQAGAQNILTNVTVDDTSPSIQYLNGWSPGPSLYIQLDGSELFNGTWHDTTRYTQDTHTKEMHVNFTGVSVYVYCVIANRPSGKPFDAFADYKFLLDDTVVGEYRHEVEDTPDFFYNVPVYVNTTLPDKEHRFSVLIDSTEKPVLMLFDYLVYTITRPPTTSELSPSHTGLPTSLLPASSQGNSAETQPSSHPSVLKFTQSIILPSPPSGGTFNQVPTAARGEVTPHPTALHDGLEQGHLNIPLKMSNDDLPRDYAATESLIDFDARRTDEERSLNPPHVYCPLP